MEIAVQPPWMNRFSKVYTRCSESSYTSVGVAQKRLSSVHGAESQYAQPHFKGPFSLLPEMQGLRSVTPSLPELYNIAHACKAPARLPEVWMLRILYVCIRASSHEFPAFLVSRFSHYQPGHCRDPYARPIETPSDDALRSPRGRRRRAARARRATRAR